MKVRTCASSPPSLTVAVGHDDDLLGAGLGPRLAVVVARRLGDGDGEAAGEHCGPRRGRNQCQSHRSVSLQGLTHLELDGEGTVDRLVDPGESTDCPSLPASAMASTIAAWIFAFFSSLSAPPPAT